MTTLQQQHQTSENSMLSLSLSSEHHALLQVLGIVPLQRRDDTQQRVATTKEQAGIAMNTAGEASAVVQSSTTQSATNAASSRQQMPVATAQIKVLAGEVAPVVEAIPPDQQSVWQDADAQLPLVQDVLLALTQLQVTARWRYQTGSSPKLTPQGLYADLPLQYQSGAAKRQLWQAICDDLAALQVKCVSEEPEVL